jgi:hypothetical protein
MKKSYLIKKDFISRLKTRTISIRNFYVLLVSLFFVPFSHGQTTTPFTSSSTWTCPAGVTSIQVEAYGAGGGGGFGGLSNRYGGGGGGGGGYSKNTSITVTPGTTYTITVGSGGIGGTANTTAAANGSNGGNSTVTFGSTTITAIGGNGGNGYINTPTGGAGGIGSTFNGGTGGTGLTSGSGGGGGCAGTTSNGGNGSVPATSNTISGGGTSGGGIIAGYGGNGNSNTSATGLIGANYGGGGGGAAKNNKGGNGAGGYVLLTYTCPSYVVSAGTNQTLAACSTSATLSGSTIPASTTGLWSVVSGTATITTPNSATSTVTGLTLSTTAILRWTISNGLCGSSYSDVSITTSMNSSCISYCNPTYANGPSTIDQITNVTLGTLNNTSGASTSPYYTFFNAVSIPNLLESSTASISISFGSDANQWAAAWIDFNQDGIFQTTEGAISSANAGSNGTTVINIPVPLGAIAGNTRMRVRGGNDSILTTAQSCGASSSVYGETEDYIVNIVALTPCTTPNQPTVLVIIPASNTIAGSFTAASPIPDNYLVVINTTGIAPTPVNGTTYTVGGTIGTGNTVVDTDNNTTFTASGLTASTPYYIYVFSFNSVCSGGPKYNSITPLNGNTTTLAPSYCIPTGNLDCSTSNDYIANVTINTLNNNTTCWAGGYTNFSATGTKTTTLTRGNVYNLSVGTGPGNKKHGLAVWIDFNQNLSFADAGEYFLIGNGVIANSTNTISITIPVGATLGTTRMRVRYGRLTTIASTSSCTMSGTQGETEDYTITIIDPITCVAPTTQPTVLILNPTANTIAGSFTAPSPAPNNYLVIINTTGIAPTPINGTTYAIGGTVGAGNTVVDNDSNATFVASGLTASTLYYIFIFSYNSACSGGPKYNITSPLNGSTTTIASNYCIPSVSSGWESSGYFSEVSFIGTLNDVSNYSTFSSSPRGYQDFTGLTNLAVQAQGEGVNISVQALNSSFMKAWVDWNKNGSFDSGEIVYDTSGISTYSSTFGFIIPSSTPVGNYRVRIRLNGRDFSNTNSNSTPSFNSCGNINYAGETEDYLFTVISSCNATISAVIDGDTCGTGTVNLVANSASSGVTQYRWYSTPTGATLIGTSTTGSWTTPTISTTTTYYVTAYNGCESLVRTAIKAVINPISSLSYSPTDPVVCGEDVVINLSATGDVEEVYLIDEKFNSGLGTFTNTNILSTAQNTASQWQNHTSTFVPTAIPNFNVWYPAISTGVNGNNFAMATSDVGLNIHNQLASATVNSTNFINLAMSFRMYYSRYYEDGQYLPLDYVTVDVSTDGGLTWPNEIKRYTEDIGIGTRFETVSFDLSAFINQTNLKVRVRYYGEWCDGLAIDDFKLYGNRPINTALSWTGSTTVNAFSDAACSLPYTTGTPAYNVYIKPTLAQLESGNYSFTAISTLANGCVTSQLITINNGSKIWQGLTSNWNDANNWKPNGVPTIDNCVIIPNNSIISGSNYQAYGKNLTVKPTGNLNVQSGNNITIKEGVKVDTNGIFQLENNSNLVQIDNTAINTGDIIYKRNANIKKYDFVYWSSPVDSYNMNNISTLTPLGTKYEWNPTVANNNGGQGNWQYSTGNPMATGKGYIAMAPTTFTTTPTTFYGTFSGKPNNGIIPIQISRGSITGAPYNGTNGIQITNISDNWNLIGNPFPSSIRANQFLVDNQTAIEGNVRLWTHGALPSNLISSPYYGTYVYNYSPGDYLTYNYTGASCCPAVGPELYIGAGQGFFVQMIEGLAGNTNVTFNNGLRSGTYDNSSFYKSSVSTVTTSNKHRIWLDIVSATNQSERTLIGYVDGATNGPDSFYDASYSISNSLGIYSLINDNKNNIQGRALPFNDQDTVPIGINVISNGTYNIAIGSLDGLFTTQNIYLEDTTLNIVHDLKQSPYSFTSTVGTFNDRFLLKYTSSSLVNQSFTSNKALAFIKDNKLEIQASIAIKQIELYDISGKLIKKYSPIELKNNFESDFNYANGAYVVKIKLENDLILTEKLMN